MYFTNTKELQEFERDMKIVPGFDRKTDKEDKPVSKNADKNDEV